MKTIAKTSYIIFGFSLLMASCQQEQTPFVVPEGADRTIEFRTALPVLTTKASEIAKDLDAFRLTAFDVTDTKLVDGESLKFYAKDVSIDKNVRGERYSSDLCVWPDPGKESDLLHFFAYYPEIPYGSSLVNKSVVSGDEKTAGLQISDYSIDEDIAKQVDFITAHTTGSMAVNYFSGITINFRHQLSRIEVKAKGEHKSCDVEIAGVAIGSTPMQGTFKFAQGEADGVWSETVKGNATYIFREGDEIVTAGAEPVSIMGKKIDEDNDNCAMLIPATASAWAYATDAKNEKKGLYLNVLLRVIDSTNTTGKGQQRYPYNDNNQGLNSPNIPRVYLAVNNSGVVTANPGQLYKDDNGIYYTNAAKTIRYIAPSGSSVKEFGWAAIPISGKWEPGMIYTYTLDYTSGVGVHGPETPGDVAPKAGDPIISDRVGVSMSVKGWQNAGNTGIPVPGN